MKQKHNAQFDKTFCDAIMSLTKVWACQYDDPADAVAAHLIAVCAVYVSQEDCDVHVENVYAMAAAAHAKREEQS